jgi:hypothetical protein
MNCIESVRLSATGLVLVAALTVTPGARADTPGCQDIVNDPTIFTCTCICGSGSSFSGCAGQSEGTAVPTPNQCPDMLQGRRVISRGDALAIADPHQHSSTQENVNVLVYKGEDDPSNSGLGIIDGTPTLARRPQVPCSGSDDAPFPQQTRFARLFDLPRDLVVTLRPTTDEKEVNQNCGAGSGKNLVLEVVDADSSGSAVATLELSHNSRWVQLAIDDFNRDGFEDILVIYRDLIQVISAVDTSDPSQGSHKFSHADTTLDSGATLCLGSGGRPLLELDDQQSGQPGCLRRLRRRRTRRLHVQPADRDAGSEGWAEHHQIIYVIGAALHGSAVAARGQRSGVRQRRHGQS